MPNRLPVLAIALGLGGLIPFFACGAGALALGPDWASRSLFALVSYGACILSFLGAVHWGFALGGAAALPPGGLQLVTTQPATVLRARLALGVVPALIGWAGLLVTLFGFPSARSAFSPSVSRSRSSRKPRQTGVLCCRRATSGCAGC